MMADTSGWLINIWYHGTGIFVFACTAIILFANYKVRKWDL